jgi:hypothetical protein
MRWHNLARNIGIIACLTAPIVSCSSKAVLQQDTFPRENIMIADTSEENSKTVYAYNTLERYVGQK